jgi:hypothetical protein
VTPIDPIVAIGSITPRTPTGGSGLGEDSYDATALAFTGADVEQLGAATLVLLMAGLGLCLAAGRRRTTR